MLSQSDNELLTRVGPGTLMGNLLRRYWTPALLSEEVPSPDSPPVRVRLLGEALIAFRDTDGKVGLVTNACPHRGASMFFGRNEETGLRCVYHGWKFDVEGTCVDMPSEPAESNFKSKVHIGAYPTHESGGIVWTYMGPHETMTPFRDFGTEDLPKEQWRANKLLTHCNWIQSMEGNLDTSHISWLHQFHAAATLPDDDSDRPGSPTNAMSIKFWEHDRAPSIETHDEWYGFRYAGLRTTPKGNTHVRVTAYCMPYTTIVASVPISYGAGGGWFVPIDDTHSWRFGCSVKAPGFERPPPDVPIFSLMPYGFERSVNGITPRNHTLENDFRLDRAAQRDVSFTGIPDFVSQDLAVTESMGPIFDRSHEHLGTTDMACIRMRSMLIKAAKDLARGIEPPVTDPALPYDRIFGAERVLAAGQDWRTLGTQADPLLHPIATEA